LQSSDGRPERKHCPARRQDAPSRSTDVVDRIRAEHAAGSSLGKIARELTADQIPTAHAGAQWWPSTVRAVLRRSAT
jgi:hypothetical protein